MIADSFYIKSFSSLRHPGEDSLRDLAIQGHNAFAPMLSPGPLRPAVLDAGLRHGKNQRRFVDLLHSGREAYRHGAFDYSIIPFSEIPPVLAEISHKEPSTRESIGDGPDNDIAEGAALIGIGFADAVAAPR